MCYVLCVMCYVLCVKCGKCKFNIAQTANDLNFESAVKYATNYIIER